MGRIPPADSLSAKLPELIAVQPEWSLKTMRKTHFASLLAVAGALAAAGCQTQNAYTDETQTSNATRGAVIGGLAGAAVGALSNPRDATENALIGGAIGAAAGGGI